MTLAYMKTNRRSVRIFDVSKKTGFSEQTIIKILKEAGFYIPSDVTFFILTQKHLTVISAYYVDAVKHLFNDTKKNRKRLQFREIEELRNFFAHFISCDLSYSYSFDTTFDYFTRPILTIDEVLNSRLDNSLIRAFFFRIVYAVPYSNRASSNFGYVASRISRNINLRFRKINSDLRAKLFTIIISNHYHIFTAEEDHISVANLGFSFSNMYTNLREAAINLKFNLKQQLLCQNINYL